MHGVLFSESLDAVRPESLNSVVEMLRDAATLAIDDNIGGEMAKSLDAPQKKKMVDR
jgi:hypothetical protein